MDINAYALSLEFTLQSNAEKVLGGIVAQIDQIESRMKNVLSGVGKVVTDSSVKMEKSISGVAKSMSEVGAQGKKATNEITIMEKATVNLVGSMDGMVKKAEESTKKMNVSDDYKKSLNEISVLMANIDDIDIFGEDKEEYIAAVAAIREEFDKLGKIRQDQNITNEDSTKTELMLGEEIKKMEEGIQNSRVNAGKRLDRARKAWMKTAQGQFKEEFLNKKQILKMSKNQLEQYEEYIDAVKDHESMKRPNERIEGRLESVAATQKNIKGIQTLKQAGDLLIGAVKKLTSAFKNFANNMGLSELTQLTTVTGLLKEVIMGTAQEEENWHTINFRAIGSMRDLQASVESAAIGNDVFRKELIKARVALREVGAGKDEIFKLDQAIGVMNRTTGAGYEGLARFAKTMTVVSGDTQKANKDLMLFQRGAKALGLTGKDLDWVLQQATESAFIMGSRGELFADKYNMALLKTAGAAKKLGMDTSSAGDVINKLKDPLGYIEILGREAFDMDPGEKLTAVAERAEEMFNRLAASGDAAREKLRISAIMGWQPADVEKNLKLLIEAGKGGTEDFAKAMMSPQQQMAKSMEDASGYLRDIQKTINSVISSIKKDFRPLFDMFKELAKMIADSPLLLWAIKWGIYLGIAGKALGSIVGFLPQLLTTAQVWQNISMLTGRTGTNISTTTTALTGMIKPGGKMALLMGKMSSLAAATGAAIAGWQLGRALDKWLGITKAAQKVEKIERDKKWGKISEKEAKKKRSELSTSDKIWANVVTAAKYSNMITAYWDYKNKKDEEEQIRIHKLLVARQKKLDQKFFDATTKKWKKISEKDISYEERLAQLGKRMNEIDSKRSKGIKLSVEDQQELNRVTNQHNALIRLRNIIEEHGSKKTLEKAIQSGKINAKEQKAIDTAKNKYTGAHKWQTELQNRLRDVREIGIGDAIEQESIEADIIEKLEKQKNKVDKLKEAYIALRDAHKKKNKTEEDSAKSFDISKEKAAEYLKQLNAVKKGSREYDKLSEKIAGETGGFATFIESQLTETLKKKTKTKGKEAEEAAKKAAKKEAAGKTTPAETVKAAADKIAKEASKAKPAQATVGTKKEEPVAEPIVTTKLEEGIADKEDENLLIAAKQRDHLEAVSRKLDGLSSEDVHSIVKLLNDYLPRIADKDTGLATTANQWYN